MKIAYANPYVGPIQSLNYWKIKTEMQDIFNSNIHFMNGIKREKILKKAFVNLILFHLTDVTYQHR